MINSSLSAEYIEGEYRRRRESALMPIAEALRQHIESFLVGCPRIDRVSSRSKGVESFVAKAMKEEDGKRKYIDPFNEIQDQIGCRIVTFYLSDVVRIDKIIKKYFRTIEHRRHIPESVWKFGYFGYHHILILPNDVIDRKIDRKSVPSFFELQIKTLFQHAWSEAEHDIGYKSGVESLDDDQKRRLAFTSAQAWGADDIFDKLFAEHNS
ncbi:MAG: GTP pyrophosphokinase family protein [Alphaproteobacteria bacterium]